MSGRPTTDLAGRRFGRLVVVESAGMVTEGGQRLAAWLCRCDCGGAKVAKAKNLQRGDTASCGCASHAVDRRGARFGWLTALEPVGPAPGSSSGNIRWRCRCVCGNEAIVAGQNLDAGATRSCGCLRRLKGALRAAKRRTVA